MHETILTPSDFVKEPEVLKFFMEDIDKLLETYEPGNPNNKPDVSKQLSEIKENRKKMINEEIQKQETMNKVNMMMNHESFQNKINEMTLIIQQLSMENVNLQNKVKYLEDKLKQLINEQIKERMKDKNIQLSSK